MFLVRPTKCLLSSVFLSSCLSSMLPKTHALFSSPSHMHPLTFPFLSIFFLHISTKLQKQQQITLIYKRWENKDTGYTITVKTDISIISTHNHIILYVSINLFSHCIIMWLFNIEGTLIHWFNHSLKTT